MTTTACSAAPASTTATTAATTATGTSPRRRVVTWNLAPGVASALYALAEYREMAHAQAVVLADILGPVLAHAVVDALPMPELPAALGDCDPATRPVLALPAAALTPEPVSALAAGKAP